MEKTVTKYGKVEAELRRRILQGDFGKEGKIPPELELADTYGVSYMTARKAVCHLVDRGLLERRARRGTFVRTRPVAGNIGIFAFHATSGGFSAGLPRYTFEKLNEFCATENRHVRAQLLPEILPDPDQVIAELEIMQVGAVGMIGFLDTDRNFIEQVAARLPVVLLNKPISGSNLPFAMPDVRKAAQLTAEYLTKNGRSRIACCLALRNHAARTQLATDIRLELDYNRIQITDDYFFTVDNYDTETKSTRAWFDRMLSQNPMPDAFLVYNEPLCRDLQHKIASLGLAESNKPLIINFQSWRGNKGEDHPWPTVMLNYPDAADAAVDMLSAAVRTGTVPAPLQRYSKPHLYT